MSSFRQYGGLNRAATNNIVRNHYSNSDNPTISNYLGQWNSKIVSESHLDLSGNSLLNVHAIYFDNGFTIIDGSLNGDVTINGNLEVTKNTKLDGSLNVFGVSNFYNQLFVNGYDATINTLTVGLGSGDISSNTVLGYQGLYSNTSGFANTALGFQSLQSNTTGALNTALGHSSLLKNTTGVANTALGIGALGINTVVSANTAVGAAALTGFNGISNSDGNTAVGAQAFWSKSSGQYNVAIGCRSGEGNEIFNPEDNFYDGSGSYNTYLGARTGVYPQYSTYEYSTAIGYGATISSSHQIKIGTASEKVVCPGDVSLNSTLEVGGVATFDAQIVANADVSLNSTLEVADAVIFNSSLNGFFINSYLAQNLFITTPELPSTFSGYTNTGIGVGVMENASYASNNICFGYYAGNGLDNGFNNMLIGVSAGASITSGSNNTILSNTSGGINGVGYNNTIVGYAAGESLGNFALTDGHSNTLIGSGAGFSITDGSFNTAIGINAYGGVNFSHSTAIGARAEPTGDHQIMLGTASEMVVCPGDVSLNSTLEVGGASTFYSTVNGIYINNGLPLNLYNIILNTSLVPNLTGSNNTMLGYNIMPNATSAGTSCCVGYQAGNSITTSQSNTLIGAEAGYAITDGSFNTAIGYHAYISGNYGYSTAIGTGAQPTDDHQIVLGTVEETVIIDGSLNVAGTTKSLYFVSGSDYRIKTDVKPLDNTFKIDQLNPVTYTNKLSGKQDTGFIAHEVQEIFPHLVTGEKDGEQTQTLNYQGLIAILTREIQELKKRVEILEKK